MDTKPALDSKLVGEFVRLAHAQTGGEEAKSVLEYLESL